MPWGPARYESFAPRSNVACGKSNGATPSRFRFRAAPLFNRVILLSSESLRNKLPRSRADEVLQEKCSVMPRSRAPGNSTLRKIKVDLGNCGPRLWKIGLPYLRK